MQATAIGLGRFGMAARGVTFAAIKWRTVPSLPLVSNPCRTIRIACFFSA